MLEYKLEKPDLSKISEIRKTFLREKFFDIYLKSDLGKYSNEKYLFWDKIKFLKIPEGLESSEELWYIIKNFRYGGYTSIKSKNWQNFKIGKPKFLEELLHKLDLSLGGSFLGIDFNETERKIFLQNGIMEEAISSSQIEGALTSSKVAREMISKGRKPITKDEKMIINNYNAMNFVKDDMKNNKLTSESLLELQSILTNDTLDFKDQVGRFRKDIDEIVIQNIISGEIYHIPPNEKELKIELESFLKYANDEDGVFTHPFIKATLLHFWIGYLHPFCDGNGRTARAIFYWYLLKKGYWGFSYIPISKLIKESKKQYGNAYIYSEQDDNDLTYFLVYIANKTSKSFEYFKNYVIEKQNKQKFIFGELNHLGLNDRQNKLITYFLENPKAYTNISIHKNYYLIARNTAKADLNRLLQKGFLKIEKQGTYINYFPVYNLENLIK